MTNIIFNNFPPRPEPVTDADFIKEMAFEALKDLLVYGYHMMPNGTEVVMVNEAPGPSIAGLIDDGNA